MRAYLRLLGSDPGPISFGLLLNFFSSFGQTFFISLFVPSILNDLAISKSAFGMYFAIATVAASFALLSCGHLIDERPVRYCSYLSLLLFVFTTIVFYFAWNPLLLALALFGLRFSGQGLFSHISQSVTARFFVIGRGKALSLTTLGFSLGEMCFPLLFGLAFNLVGWRTAILLAPVALLLLLLPLLHVLDLERLDLPPQNVKPRTTKKIRIAFYRDMLRQPIFYIVALPIFMISFCITGIFFYQYALAETRGWPMETYSMLFAGYAITRLITSLYGGVLIDTFTAVRVYPVFLLPLAIGAFILGTSAHILAGLSFLLLAGVAVGLSAVVKAAVLAELYPVETIGQVRSLYSVVMVVSSALAPLVFGFCLDRGISYTEILYCVSVGSVLASLHTLRITTHARELQLHNDKLAIL